MGTDCSTPTQASHLTSAFWGHRWSGPKMQPSCPYTPLNSCSNSVQVAKALPNCSSVAALGSSPIQSWCWVASHLLPFWSRTRMAWGEAESSPGSAAPEVASTWALGNPPLPSNRWSPTLGPPVAGDIFFTGLAPSVLDHITVDSSGEEPKFKSLPPRNIPEFLVPVARTIFDGGNLPPALVRWRTTMVQLAKLIHQWKEILGADPILRRSIAEGRCNAC